MLRKLLIIILLTAALAACTGEDQDQEATSTAVSQTLPEDDVGATDEAMTEDEEMMATDEAMVEDEDMMATDEAMAEDEDMTATDEAMTAGSTMTSTVTFSVTIENVSPDFAYSDSGVFNTALDATEPGPAMPGSSFEITFNAAPGDSLSFATMFAQSNDWFFAPGEAGIALFDADGNPVSGDVTDQVLLWDAGTEADQEPGTGPNQAPRQAAPNTGEADPNDTVRQVTDDTIPAVTDQIQVTLEPGENNSFTLRLDNISGDSSLPTPISPGVIVVHQKPAALFTAGETDRGEGLEGLAEDGDPAALGETVTAQTGLVTPISPGVFAVHQQPDILYAAGEPTFGQGLESLAEDGDPAVLADSLAAMDALAASGVFNMPNGMNEPGPLMPGHSYNFNFDAMSGYQLSLATMFVQSNDLFYAIQNLPLFDENGQPIQGDITMQFALWDAGTEVNGQPGVGPNQAPRQPAPDTGESEGGVVQLVDDGFSYPATAQVIQVTISPMNMAAGD